MLGLLVKSFVECRMDEVEMMGRMECLVILVVFVDRVVWWEPLTGPCALRTGGF